MKKKYDAPQLEIEILERNDVISTSSFDGVDHVLSSGFSKI